MSGKELGLSKIDRYKLLIFNTKNLRFQFETSNIPDRIGADASAGNLRHLFFSGLGAHLLFPLGVDKCQQVPVDRFRFSGWHSVGETGI